MGTTPASPVEPGVSRRRRVLGTAVVIIVAAAVWGLIIASWLRLDLAGRAAWMLLVVGLFAVGAQSASSERFAEAVERFFGVWMLSSVVLMAALAPPVLALLATKVVAESLGGLGQALLLSVWGAGLAAALLTTATPTRRRASFARVRRLGWLAPWVYSIDLLLVAVVFFSTLTFVLWDAGAVQLAAGSAAVGVDGILALFVWHFLDAVPLLDVTGTLGWSAPLTYEDAGVGWLLLAFKVVVIVPVIATLRTWWKLTHDSDERARTGAADTPAVPAP